MKHKPYLEAAKLISNAYIKHPNLTHYACNALHFMGYFKEVDDFGNTFAPTYKEIQEMYREGNLEHSVMSWYDVLDDTGDIKRSAFFSSSTNVVVSDRIAEYDCNCRLFALLLMQEMIDNPNIK